MVGRGRRVSAYGALLRNPSYRIWFGTAFCGGIADWTGLFALQVLVVTLTEPGSRLKLFALGGIMMARLLPSLVLGPVAGVLADRYDRKRLMVFTNVVRAVIYVSLATAESLVTLFALVFIVESLSLLYLSSKDASLPVIVRRDHLTQANQLNLLVTYGTLPLGAVIATTMIPVAGVLRGLGWTTVTPPVVALLFTASAFAVAGLLLSRLRLAAALSQFASRTASKFALAPS
jgi:dTMP kinase